MTFAQCQGCASPACIVNGECCFPKEAPTPIAWGLLNPMTGKMGPKLYVREDMARVGAAAMTNRWRTLIAVPLFLWEWAEPATAAPNVRATEEPEPLPEPLPPKTEGA